MPSPRVAGVTLPLFSLRSIRTGADWGIGEIGDLPTAASWIRRAGHRLLQILPPHELAPGETSPYGARTAFGIDPIYLSLADVPELAGGELDAALGDEGRTELGALGALASSTEGGRAGARVDYARVRTLKARVLHEAFLRFKQNEWAPRTGRGQSLERFIDDERHWARDLALYVALRDEHEGHGWTTWPEGERDRAPEAMAAAEERLADAILEHHYGQWLALDQWSKAREAMRARGVELMGDLPFIVGQESADVWSHAEAFRTDVSLGVPPDAFAPEGQDWGLPAYDWARMEEDDFAWLRARARHAARLYDRFRLDHVLGFYRMFVKSRAASAAHDGDLRKVTGSFVPEGNEAQRAHGERVLKVVAEAARPAAVIAEDLGMVPPYVRLSLPALEIPGYKVLPWEKGEDDRFRAPAAFPALSVACWSTHDTAPITSWWDALPEGDREQLSHLAKFANERAFIAPAEREMKLLRLLFESGSALTLAQAQELIGDGRRVNTPGTVGGENWTYRLPQTIEAMDADPGLAARFGAIKAMAEETGR